jgi:hypothetical protein
MPILSILSQQIIAEGANQKMRDARREGQCAAPQTVGNDECNRAKSEGSNSHNGTCFVRK